MQRSVLLLLAGIVFAACTTFPVEIAQEDKPELAKRICVEDREALLDLNYKAFDQDIWGGWREVSYRNNNGCQREAAQLIADYKAQATDLEDWQLRMLHWHEGQLYAFEGESKRAIGLFGESYEPNPKNKAWNLYVTASIAFLNKDRFTFDNSYDELRDIPKPAHWEEMVKNTEETYNYTPLWPNNINVFEAFDRCFEKTYSEAYSGCNEGIRKFERMTAAEAESSESP